MSSIYAPEQSKLVPSRLPRVFAGPQLPVPETTAANRRRLFRTLVERKLSIMRLGKLRLIDGASDLTFGGPDAPLDATLVVHSPRFYRSIALGGALGAAESYMQGDWDSPDLTAAMRLLGRNAEVTANVEKGMARLLQPFRAVVNRVRRNSRSGSKRNIAAHYDLSNEFFGLMLDSTMTYSSGVFATPNSTLEEASTEKYDRICRKLRLSPNDHVLEIGTGWGGFAEHAAQRYGCRVTTTTISQQQHDYARRRFAASGIEDRVELLQQDYRDLRGKYDKLVSIEMIEAVGEQFLPNYFEQCSRLLKSHGMMMLQAITIPDHRYDRYRRSVDFIQRYIFPGGFLPSMGSIAESLRRRTNFRCYHLADFGSHYAQTLHHWRHNFWNHIAEIKELGFDERFIRTWHYYLCYCEAGFRERQIGVSQMLFTKPDCRLAPILDA